MRSPTGHAPGHTATFVGSVVGFLNVLKYTPAEPPPCRRGSLIKSNWYVWLGHLASGHLLLPESLKLSVSIII